MRSGLHLVGSLALLAALGGLIYIRATGEGWPLAFSIAMTTISLACGIAAAIVRR